MPNDTVSGSLPRRWAAIPVAVLFWVALVALAGRPGRRRARRRAAGGWRWWSATAPTTGYPAAQSRQRRQAGGARAGRERLPADRRRRATRPGQAALRPRGGRVRHAIGTANVALFYYSGHGLQVDGVNYLVPVDANPVRRQDLAFQMVSADARAGADGRGSGTKLNILILDACRNNPFAGGGLAAPPAGGSRRCRRRRAR